MLSSMRTAIFIQCYKKNKRKITEVGKSKAGYTYDAKQQTSTKL